MARWFRFDFILLFSMLALSGIGAALIHSATGLNPGQAGSLTSSPAFRQGLIVLLGVIIIVVLSAIDYDVLTYHPLAGLRPAERGQPAALNGLTIHHEQYSSVERDEKRLGVAGTIALFVEGLTNPFYVVGIALLAAVQLVGRSAGGSQRWIDLGFIDFQPSELMKLLLVIALARYLSDHIDDLHDIRHLLVAIVMTALPVVLVIKQPDLGTAMCLLAVWVGIIFMAGVRWRHVLLLAAAAAAAMPTVWQRLLSDYQRERLTIFVDPTRDALGAGYQLIQSRISVGSGGLWGRGLNSGTQSQLNFLRIQHTDYIFAVLGEELGFVGGTLVVLLYALVIFQGLMIASHARDSFGGLLAVGIVSMLIFQVFVNIGMNIGLMPVTGIPLPFISYGRSSLLMLMLAIGILESVSVRRRSAET